MERIQNIPPLGMCFQDRCFMPFYNSPLFNIVREEPAPKSSIKGRKLYDLGKWYDCVLKVSLRYGENIIEDVNAVIDTGAYYSNIKREILIKLGCVQSETFLCQNTLYYGNVKTPSFTLEMSINGLEGDLTDSFVEAPPYIEYPILLGTYFLKLCDLNFFGKRGQFELVF